jgi:hypothetical protein
LRFAEGFISFGSIPGLSLNIMKLYLAMFLLVTFSSCVVRVIEPSPIVTKPKPIQTVVVVSNPSVLVINQRIGLPAYPNSRVFNLEEDGDSRKVEFETNASLNQVYGFFHNELLRRGWLRSKLNIKSSATKVEARYQRPNERFDFKLDQQGNSGRYKLEIKF